jgi:inhibitor of KinA
MAVLRYPDMSPDVHVAIEWIGDTHLRVTLASDISLASHARVRAAYQQLLGARVPGLLEITPAFASLFLRFDAAELDPHRAAAHVREMLSGASTTAATQALRISAIPVCYEGEYAPDLADVAAMCSLRASEVVEMHAAAEYLVYFLGFMPGFPYLGGLPARLNVPRLPAPRARVPAGSVAIAGDQAGIYPHATPGGWRIIGRTPLRLFDATRPTPALLAMGEGVRFVPIDAERFRSLEGGAA